MRVMLVVVVVVLGLVGAATAAAASFPCGSFLHQLHTGKKTGEVFVTSQVKKYQHKVDKDSKAVAADKESGDTDAQQRDQDRLDSDLTRLGFWKADLHYLGSIRTLIGQQNCSAFNYVKVDKWFRHRSRFFHHDRARHASHGRTHEELIRNDRIAEHDNGALTAIDPNHNRLVAIAKQHGVTIP